MMKNEIHEIGWKLFKTNHLKIKNGFITSYPSERCCRFLYRVIGGKTAFPRNYKIPKTEKLIIEEMFRDENYDYMKICNLIVENLNDTDLVLSNNKRAVGYCYIAAESFYYFSGVNKHKWKPVVENCGWYNHWTLYNKTESIYIDFPGNKECHYYHPCNMNF